MAQQPELKAELVELQVVWATAYAAPDTPECDRETCLALLIASVEPAMRKAAKRASAGLGTGSEQDAFGLIQARVMGDLNLWKPTGGASPATWIFRSIRQEQSKILRENGRRMRNVALSEELTDRVLSAPSDTPHVSDSVLDGLDSTVSKVTQMAGSAGVNEADIAGSALGQWCLKVGHSQPAKSPNGCPLTVENALALLG